MPTFTVQAASHKKDVEGKNGPMKVLNLTLVEADGSVKAAEWFTKATTPIPQQGEKLEGELQAGQYGLSFKKAQQGGGWGGGGGGGRKDTPETRRSIAMQSSQKVAVDAVRIAVEAGLWKPESPVDVVGAVLKASDRFYLRVMAAENDEVKA